MKKVLVFLAQGFEESEAICPIDVMKRAGLDVVIAGIGGDEFIVSSHGVAIKVDIPVEEAVASDYSAVFCPGGMPGAVNLAQSWSVNEILIDRFNSGAIVAAICASPAVILGPLGLLKGKKATCYPGCEGYSPKLEFLTEGVVIDGNLITAKAAGYGFDLGLAIVELLIGKEKADEVKASIYYKEM